MSFSLRRKPKRRDKVTQFGCVDIYSTLSKKPADLKTTDIDLSAIRVFLGDGSHRTIRCTPTTTCGEILTKLLHKLGLSDRAEEYALQIKYTFAESRLADEIEEVSELNQHVWDSVDRIYLFKITDSPPHITRRKRLASFEGNLNQEEREVCAVVSHNVEPDTDEEEPVLVNNTLLSNFAKAWNRGTELHKAGDSGGQKLIASYPFQLINENVKTPQFSPQRERKYSYTLDRKQKTICRRPPVNTTLPRKSPVESPTSSPGPQHRRLVMCREFQSKTDVSTIATSAGTRRQARSVYPDQPSQNVSSLSRLGENELKCHRSPSPSNQSAANERNLAANNLPNFSFIRKKSLSEACLLTATNAERKIQAAHSQDTLRDSGFDDSYRSCHSSTSELRFPSHPPSQSGSLENIPGSLLAKCALKTPLAKSKSFEGTSGQRITTPNTPPRKSKSLSSQGIAAVLTSLFGLKPVELCSTIPSSPARQPPPIVPQRTSAYLENCTVPDDYLLMQGKRMSQLLQITPKKEEKTTFLHQSTPSPGNKPLGFHDTSWDTGLSSCKLLSSPQCPLPTSPASTFSPTVAQQQHSSPVISTHDQQASARTKSNTDCCLVQNPAGEEKYFDLAIPVWMPELLNSKCKLLKSQHSEPPLELGVQPLLPRPVSTDVQIENQPTMSQDDGATTTESVIDSFDANGEEANPVSKMFPELPILSPLDTSTPIKPRIANGMIHRSWSTPIEDPREELKQRLKKRVQAARTITSPSKNPLNTSPPPPLPSPPPPPLPNLPSKLSNAPAHSSSAEETKVTPPPPPPPPLQSCASSSSHPSPAEETKTTHPPPPPLPKLLSRLSNSPSHSSPTEETKATPPPPPLPPTPSLQSSASSSSHDVTPRVTPPPPPPPPPPTLKTTLSFQSGTTLAPALRASPLLPPPLQSSASLSPYPSPAEETKTTPPPPPPPPPPLQSSAHSLSLCLTLKTTPPPPPLKSSASLSPHPSPEEETKTTPPPPPPPPPPLQSSARSLSLCLTLKTTPPPPPLKSSASLSPHPSPEEETKTTPPPPPPPPPPLQSSAHSLSLCLTLKTTPPPPPLKSSASLSPHPSPEEETKTTPPPPPPPPLQSSAHSLSLCLTLKTTPPPSPLKSSASLSPHPSPEEETKTTPPPPPPPPPPLQSSARSLSLRLTLKTTPPPPPLKSSANLSSLLPTTELAKTTLPLHPLPPVINPPSFPSGSQLLPPPPPPPPPPPLLTFKPSSTTHEKVKDHSTVKNPGTRPAELFSRELATKLKSISKKIDDTSSNNVRCTHSIS